MKRLILLALTAFLLYNTAYSAGPIKRLTANRFAGISQMIDLASTVVPDTTHPASPDSLNVIALSDTTLATDHARYISVYGNGTVSVVNGILLCNFTPVYTSIDSLIFWIRATSTESDSCSVPFILRNPSGTVAVNSTLSATAADTWERKSFVLSESGVYGTWLLSLYPVMAENYEMKISSGIVKR